MFDNLTYYKEVKNKTQIILCNTNKSIDDYLNYVENRSKVYYDKVPHIIVTEKGDVHELIDTNYYGNFFGIEEIDMNSIILLVENLGWLKKDYLSGKYINWNKDIYKDEPIIKQWRSYTYWAKYPDIIYDKLSELIIHLTKKHDIVLEFIGHNTKLNNIQVFNGITTRSNYSDVFTDVTPAFNFEKLKELTYGKNY